MFQCHFPERHKHGDRNWSSIAWVSDEGNLCAFCYGCGAKRREYVQAIGLPVAAWYPDKGQSRDQRGLRMKPLGKLVATYVYRDAAGGYLYEKQRFESPDGKTFKQRRALPAELRKELQIPDGAECWVHGIQGDRYHKSEHGWNFYPGAGDKEIVLSPCPSVLYRLPEMLAADKARPVLVCEGEKDVDMLRGLGFVAVCGPSASSHWSHDWSRDLAGRRVCIIPDHDHVGRDHAAEAAGSLLMAGVQSLRVVQWEAQPSVYWPGKDGGGAGNWLALANPTGEKEPGKAAVVDLCKRAVEYARAGAA